MNKLFATFLLLVCALMQVFTIQAQTPVDNPYRTHYNPSGGHWTDSLLWWRTLDVTSLGAVANDNQDDYAAIQAGIDSVHAMGGGVLFFPAGMFNSSESLKMKSGVVLRGVASLEPNAHDSAFAPQSKLWFPQFVFDSTANGGLGNDRSAAFKSIESEYNCKYSGIIDMDLNRVSVKYQPSYIVPAPAGFTTPQPSSQIGYIIIQGLRSNNAAYPSPDVPRAEQKPWQLVLWRFSANIDIAGHHVIVARTRHNQGVDKDNFMMPGYLIQNRASPSAWVPLTLAQDPHFDYDAHYCISVNRKKLTKDSTGKRTIYGVETYANPQNEPSLFHPQIEILDNWMYHTSRVALIAAGVDVTIKNNIIKDDSTKPFRENFLGSTGTRFPQGATTFENRAIDFSGWRILCEGNDLEVFQNKVGGYLSTDGEGILVQECCGGTSVNDYIIRNNRVRQNNFVGLYKMRDCHNVLIEGNVLGRTGIQVTANTNNETFGLYNVQVRNNIGLTGLQLTGSKGGYNVHSEGNRFTENTFGILHPCFATETNNLTNITSTPVQVRFNSDNGLTLNPAVPATPGSACLPLLTSPLVQWDASHQIDSIFTNGLGVPTTVLLKAKMQTGNLTSDTVAFYLNGVKIADNISYSIFDSIARYAYDIPDANGVYSFNAVVYNNGKLGYSPVINYIQNNVVSVSGELQNRSQLLCYPNPASQYLNVVLPAASGTLRLLDVTGKTLRQQVLSNQSEDEPVVLNLRGLNSGVYLLQFTSPAATHTQRIIRQ